MEKVKKGDLFTKAPEIHRIDILAWLNPAARRAFGEQLEAQSGEERRWLLSWTAPADRRSR